MATLRSDIIIPEVFTPYVIEQTTQRDAFLASGVVQPLAELNATEGGDFINVPFWKANLSGDFEVLTDSTSLTPGKIQADKQVGVILHRGRAFESRDLAALAAGSDPMAAIGAKPRAAPSKVAFFMSSLLNRPVRWKRSLHYEFCHSEGNKKEERITNIATNVFSSPHQRWRSIQRASGRDP